MADEVRNAIERAIGTSYFTQPIPQSVGARARYLLKREGGSVARAAARTGVSPTTFRRWAASRDLKQRITPAAAGRLRTQVEAEWQPGLRARRIKQLAAAGGVTVDARAQFGFSAPIGTTDDPRERRITQRLPSDGQTLLDAYQAGVPEQGLRDIIAAGLQDQYFQDAGSRAQGLQVEFTGIQYIDLEF